MNCYPFIEADKARQHNVKRAGELLKVSRAAFYAAREGQRCDRDREDAELTARINWKKTTIPDPAAAARADAIRRDFTADAARINQRWCGNITYLATWEGWVYLLVTVIDIASRRVVGFALADHLRTELADPGE